MPRTPTVQEVYGALDVEHAKGRVFDGINACLEACARNPRLDGADDLIRLLHAFARALEEECCSSAVQELLEQHTPHLARNRTPDFLRIHAVAPTKE